MTSKASVDQKEKHGYVYLISIVAAVGGFLFGYDISIISGAVIFIKEEFDLSGSALGFAMSSAQIGSIFGAVFGGKISDLLGRKKSLFFAALLFGLSAIFTAMAGSMGVFNVFRFVGGLAVGLASIVSPMYIAEVSPSSIRGRLVTLNQFAICIGLLSAIIVSYFLSFSQSWRWMFASEGVPILFFAVGLFLIPESPRWLVKKERNKEAFLVLKRISNESTARMELREIEDSLHSETGKFSELFQKGIRMALIIAVLLAFFQQWSGATPMLLYAPLIFQKAGFIQASDAIFQSVLLAGWLVLCTTFALWLVERVGRRQLLIFGTLTMAVGMICTSLFFYLKMKGIFLLFMMFLSIGAYSISLAPLAWLIMAEIFPTRIRGVAMSIASLVLWVSTVMVNQLFPILTSLSEKLFGTGFGIFLIYAMVCVITAIFVWLVLPETKGKSLEQISAYWIKRSQNGNRRSVRIPDADQTVDY